MQDDLDILRQAGADKNPFTVPDGYFDTLTERIMQQLPDAGPVAVARTVPMFGRLVKWAAVCLATVGVGLGVYLSAVRSTDRQPAANMAAYLPADDSLDQMADYMMLDQEELYAYIANE